MLDGGGRGGHWTGDAGREPACQPNTAVTAGLELGRGAVVTTGLTAWNVFLVGLHDFLFPPINWENKIFEQVPMLSSMQLLPKCTGTRSIGASLLRVTQVGLGGFGVSVFRNRDGFRGCGSGLAFLEILLASGWLGMGSGVGRSNH